MEEILKEYKKNKDFYDKTLRQSISDAIDGRICHHKVVVLHIICKLYSIKNYLEIGVHNGSSMSYVVQEPSTKTCYGIDLFEDTRGIQSFDVVKYQQDNLTMEKSYQNIQRNNHNSQIHLISGDSSAKETIEKVNEMVNEPINLLFIDGSHAYDGVRQDFQNYQKLVKVGGFIVFDDYEPNYPDVMKVVNDHVKTNASFETIGVFENNELIVRKIDNK